MERQDGRVPGRPSGRSTFLISDILASRRHVPTQSRVLPTLSGAVRTLSNTIPTISGAVPIVSGAIQTISDVIPTLSGTISTITDGATSAPSGTISAQSGGATSTLSGTIQILSSAVPVRLGASVSTRCGGGAADPCAPDPVAAAARSSSAHNGSISAREEIHNNDDDVTARKQHKNCKKSKTQTGEAMSGLLADTVGNFHCKDLAEENSVNENRKLCVARRRFERNKIAPTRCQVSSTDSSSNSDMQDAKLILSCAQDHTLVSCRKKVNCEEFTKNLDTNSNSSGTNDDAISHSMKISKENLNSHFVEGSDEIDVENVVKPLENNNSRLKPQTLNNHDSHSMIVDNLESHSGGRTRLSVDSEETSSARLADHASFHRDRLTPCHTGNHGIVEQGQSPQRRSPGGGLSYGRSACETELGSMSGVSGRGGVNMNDSSVRGVGEKRARKCSENGPNEVPKVSRSTELRENRSISNHPPTYHKSSSVNSIKFQPQNFLECNPNRAPSLPSDPRMRPLCLDPQSAHQRAFYPGARFGLPPVPYSLPLLPLLRLRFHGPGVSSSGSAQSAAMSIQCCPFHRQGSPPGRSLDSAFMHNLAYGPASPLYSSHSLFHENSPQSGATSDLAQNYHLRLKCRRNRTVYSEHHLACLETQFSRQKYLSTKDRVLLAGQLGLTQIQIKTWYQNRRMKWKKQVLQDGGTHPPTKPKGRPKKMDEELTNVDI